MFDVPILFHRLLLVCALIGCGCCGCVAADAREGKPTTQLDAAQIEKDDSLHLIWVDQTEKNGETTRRYGYINGAGRVVIPLHYEEAWPFSEGLAKVLLGDGWAFVKPSGEIAFRVPDDWLVTNGFSEGRAVFNLGGTWNIDAMNGGKWGFIDSAGKIVIEPRFADVRAFSEGLAAVATGDMRDPASVRWGFIDPDGRMVIEPQFRKIESDGFHHGVAFVKLISPRDPDELQYLPVAYIDRSGKVIWQSSSPEP